MSRIVTVILIYHRHKTYLLLTVSIKSSHSTEIHSPSPSSERGLTIYHIKFCNSLAPRAIYLSYFRYLDFYLYLFILFIFIYFILFIFIFIYLYLAK
jgi:hypothetical protein